MSSTSFLFRIKLAIYSGVLLMGLVGLASYLSISQLIETSRLRSQTEDHLILIERATATLKAGESAVRQYLMSGEAGDLEIVSQARVSTRESLDQLRQFKLLSDADQKALDDVLTKRRALTTQALAAREARGVNAVAAIMGGDISRLLRAQTEGLMDAARARETLRWRNAQATAQRGAELAQYLILAGGLLFLFMLGWVIYVVNHYEELRKKVEAQLRDSEAMSRSITEGMAEGVITTTSDDIILEANDAALKLFGYEKSELLGRDVSDLVPLRMRAAFKEFTAGLRARSGAVPMTDEQELRGLRKDGSELSVSLAFGDVQVAGRRLFTGLIRDITESKRIARALRASETQLRQITNAVPALICYLDRDERFRFHNKAYEELFGLEFAQIDGHLLQDVLDPQSYQHAKPKVAEVLRGHAVHYERPHATPDGVVKHYAMTYFPNYGEGKDEGKVIGFFSLGTDITELRRIDRMKTEFVSTVSHELRTPLTSIRGSLGLIAGGVAGELPDAARNLVGIAKSNCERLIRLINDILDSEKIEAGKLHLKLETLDIKQLIEHALLANEGFATQHRVKLVLQAPKAPLQVQVDSDRMTQVLTNLLSNAVKFSPAGQSVEVHVSCMAGHRIRVEVIDHGPGIPEEFRGRIFQKFSQADASDTKQKGGTGLGLNISRALVEQMGGTIGFGSVTGKGTTFFFELPEWAGSASTREDSAALAAPSLDLARPRILHVEGDDDVQRIVAAIAGDFATFEFAATLGEARAHLQAQAFDLVLLDIALGAESGRDLFEDIDALDPRPPVIVFSASDFNPAELRRAEAVLVKADTSNTELLNTIQQVLRIPGDPGPSRPQVLS